MVRPSFDENAAGFVDTMHAARASGVPMMMHCQDAAIIQTTAARMMAEGRGGLEHFLDERPVSAEVSATQRAVTMAEATGAPIYVVHRSSERALRVAEDAQRRGLAVYVETRPIYLYLTRERFDGPTPGLYIGQPPLRTQTDQDALWAGIANGSIHVVGTLHRSLLPHVHQVASLLKRWLLGTHQGAVSREHLDYYLDEFPFRFNRRTSRARGLLFYRLLDRAVRTAPATTASLFRGTNRGKRSLTGANHKMLGGRLSEGNNQICPIFSLVAPGRPGASPVSVLARLSPRAASPLDL